LRSWFREDGLRGQNLNMVLTIITINSNYTILFLIRSQINNIIIKQTVLIHLDQHFIERGPYRSERERTLEIIGGGRIVSGLISHTCLGSINNSPGPYYQLSLLHTEPRARTGVEQTATFLSLDPDNQRGKDCLRGSQTICSL
jgi:hypothetical protein